MDERTRGRRRARWTTGTLVALSLTGTVGLGVAVEASPAISATSPTTATTSAGTPSAATPTTTSGSGSTHATTAGS